MQDSRRMDIKYLGLFLLFSDYVQVPFGALPMYLCSNLSFPERHKISPFPRSRFV